MFLAAHRAQPELSLAAAAGPALRNLSLSRFLQGNRRQEHSCSPEGHQAVRIQEGPEGPCARREDTAHSLSDVLLSTGDGGQAPACAGRRLFWCEAGGEVWRMSDPSMRI